MAAPAPGPLPGVLVIGAGLAGSLLALALRERNQAVTLLDQGLGLSAGAAPSATALSYGVVPGWPLAPTPLSRLAARAAGRWRGLEQRHGALGWQPARLAALPPLPVSRVDGARLAECLPQALAAAGVDRRRGLALGLQRSGSLWQLDLQEGPPLQAAQVVLAAGSGCRALWPGLPGRLRTSWAGVLQLEQRPPELAADQLRLPLHFQRLALERRAPQVQARAWVVDPGLVPRGPGALAGQLTLVAPDGDQGEPDPGWMEQRLRESLAPLGLDRALQQARFHQTPVSFCAEGSPLAGPLPGAPGLWVFTGFSGGFAQVPVLAPLLAEALAPLPAEPLEAARRRLRQLGVWPQEPPGADRGA